MMEWHMLRPILRLLLVSALLGCAKKEAVEPAQAAVQGTTNTEGLLAYEHSVRIDLPAGTLSTRMADMRGACLEARHGRCSLLEFTENLADHAVGGRGRGRPSHAAQHPCRGSLGGGGRQRA
jgi:hypothetical protein